MRDFGMGIVLFAGMFFFGVAICEIVREVLWLIEDWRER